MIKTAIPLILITLIISGCLYTRSGHSAGKGSAKEVYARSLEEFGVQNYLQAEMLLKTVIEKESLFYPAYRSLVDVYEAGDDLDGAVLYFSSLTVGSNPYPAWALGLVYEKMGLYDNAIGFYKRSIETGNTFHTGYEGLVDVYLAKQECDKNALWDLTDYLSQLSETDPKNSGPYYGSGYLLIKQWKYQEAMAEFYKASRNTSQLVYTRHKIGEVFLHLGKNIQALGYLNKSIKEYKKIGDIKGEADTLNTMGDIFLYTPNHLQALEKYEKALSLYRLIRDVPGEINSLQKIGCYYRELSNQFKSAAYFEKAIEYYKKILLIYQEKENKEGEALNLDTIGFAYSDFSNYSGALEYFEKALSLRQETGDKAGMGWSFSNIGLAYFNLSDYPHALEYLEKSLVFSRETGNKENQGWTCNTIGMVYNELSDYPKALEYFKKALTIHTETGNKFARVLILAGIGRVYRKISSHQKALVFLNKSLILSKGIDYKEGEGVALNTIGLVYYDLLDYQKALKYLTEALALRMTLSNREEEGETLRQIGNVHLSLKEYEQAFSFYKKAVSITESIRGSFKSEKFKTSYFQKKMELYGNTLTCLYELHKQNPARGFDRLAFTYAERSKARGLLDLLAESNARIEQGVDPELAEQERKLEAKFAGINTQLQKLLANPADQVDKQRILSLEADLETVDSQLEKLKEQIVRKNPAYAELKYPEPITGAQVQQTLLDKNTICIEYKVTREAVFAWKITDTNFTFYKLQIPEEELTYQVMSLRNCLAGLMDEEIFTRRSIALYDSILLPLLKEELKEKKQQGTKKRDKLLIIPDGILSYLPFETLVQPGENSDVLQKIKNSVLTYQTMPYLLKEYTIRYAQSAAVAYNLAGRKKRKPASRELIALGDPVFSTEEAVKGNRYIRKTLRMEDRGTLQRLIYSGEEVKEIGRLFSNAFINIREEAREELIKSPELEQYRYIHLAAHGIINEQQPRFSGIVLTQDDDPAEDGFLLTKEIFNLKLNADLVVLSACGTGLGKRVAGEGVVGLTRAWFYAGAGSLVVSLWNINDRSTSYLMKSFYTNIHSGAAYSRALREAKLEMIKKSTPAGKTDYAHPYYWAGFVLLGGE